MDDQLTVRLPRELNAVLRSRAASMQRKPSELVRMAIAEFLHEDEPPLERPARLVSHLIGSLETGIPDLAVKHREHLLKSLRRGR